jgi:hypothetical protein
MKLVSIGKTEEGRDQWMAIISSPGQHPNLEQIPADLAPAGARRRRHRRAGASLAREGKAVVWIDGGCTPARSVGSQQLMEMVYQMVSRTDPETMRF